MQNNSVGVRSAAQRQALAPRARTAFGSATVSRQWTSAAASRRRERPATSALPRGRSADLGCPYEVLGLPPGTSDEAAVKRAYRKLAKKYHPDVLLNSQHAATQPHQPAPTATPQQASEEPPQHPAEHPVQFLSIAEAYSFIMERLRNGVAADGVSPRPGNSRAFHEWMWEFRMRRTWQRQQRQAAAAPPGAGTDADADDEEPVAEDACGCSDSPTGMGMNGGAAAAGAHHAVPQSAEGLRSQLAGLRHRAAIRKNRPPTPSPAGSASEADEPPSPPAVHPAFERGAGTWFAAATGPSDSADPSPAAAAAHVASVEAEHAAGGAAAAAEQPAPEQGGVEGHEAAAAAGGARRRFASNSTVREALREQLSGMRRKAAMRERIYSGGGGAPEAGFDGMAA